MESSLLSTGKAGAWTVTIEEPGNDGMFSVWLQSPLAHLQFNIPDLTDLRSVSQFLRLSEKEDRWFELHDCLGGILAFVVHDESLLIRLTVAGGQMFKVRFDFSEAEALGSALDDALTDAI